MVIPIHDKNPTRRFPVVTYAILIINVVIYFFGPSFGDQGLPKNVPDECKSDAFVQQWAAIPKELTEGHQLPHERVDLVDGNTVIHCPAAHFDKSPPLSALSSMFLHGGLLHLLGNMLFLFIFGNNVEDRFGRWRFALFYLLCGYTATYAFAFTNPDSTTPLVGASGAIAGVLGAYLWLYPRARIVALVPFLFFLPLPLPAWLVLGSWFGLQAIYSQGGGLGEGSVAYVAHVVGFAVGFVLTVLFIGDRKQTPPPPPTGRGSHGRR